VAAQVLAGIDLERSTRNVDVVDKLRRYIKIAQLYLEDDDAVAAEQYFIKAREGGVARVDANRARGTWVSHCLHLHALWR